MRRKGRESDKETTLPKRSSFTGWSRFPCGRARKQEKPERLLAVAFGRMVVSQMSALDRFDESIVGANREIAMVSEDVVNEEKEKAVDRETDSDAERRRAKWVVEPDDQQRDRSRGESNREQVVEFEWRMAGDMMRAMNLPKNAVKHPAVQSIGNDLEPPESEKRPAEKLKDRHAQTSLEMNYEYRRQNRGLLRKV